MTFSLETFVRLANLIQLEDRGPTDPAVLKAIPDSESAYHTNGDRPIIHMEDAPDDLSFSPTAHLASSRNQHDDILYLAVPRNGFKDASVLMTHLWKEPPYHQSGRHKHLEAVVDAVDGEGYTAMLGQTSFWEAADVLDVPPAMWGHEHGNDSPRPIRQLRIQFGIRFWYTGIWPAGYAAQRICDERGRPIESGAIERRRERD